jgi:hypothetical protein
MLRALATWIAKWKYVWNKETEAGLHTWSARVSEANAKVTRDVIVKLKAGAEELEARIKDVAEMEEEGFWLCDNGHEKRSTFLPTSEQAPRTCLQCQAPAKFIKRSEMTGQEKYESDKDCKDAEQMLAARRKEITDKETDADQQDATVKYFRHQAESSRKLADSIRNL